MAAKEWGRGAIQRDALAVGLLRRRRFRLPRTPCTAPGSNSSLDGAGRSMTGERFAAVGEAFQTNGGLRLYAGGLRVHSYWYSLGTRKLCTPLASSVTVPAGKMITGLPSSSTSNSVFSSMVT